MEKDISVVIPIYDGMKNREQFLWESIDILTKQTVDYELIISKTGGSMGHNFNEGIKRAKGRLIKILCQDDRLADENSLKRIIEAFKGHWLVTGSSDNLNPYYTGDIHLGNNKLGSPSALTIKNDNPMLFDEKLSWLIDCDYYKRMYKKYGEPIILIGNHVEIGKHAFQATNLLSNDIKLQELEDLKYRIY